MKISFLKKQEIGKYLDADYPGEPFDAAQTDLQPSDSWQDMSALELWDELPPMEVDEPDAPGTDAAPIPDHAKAGAALSEPAPDKTAATGATDSAPASDLIPAMGPASASDPAEEDSEEEMPEEHHIPTIAEEIRTLALKIMFVLIAFFVVFTFIFGLHRNLSVGMQPSLRDGDLLFYYRLDKNFRANNVVVFEYQDEMIASRVVAVPGDTVDITADGLVINGSVMIEPEIYSETTQFKDGPTFPLTVQEDTVFVLGDNREHANDSRIIGLINDKDIKGKVMGVIRRRNM